MSDGELIAAPRTDGPPVTVEDLLALRRPTEAVCAAGGDRIAISVLDPPAVDRAAGSRGSIWIADGDAPAASATDTGGLDVHPRWSPDGRELAFASDANHPGRMSLYVLPVGAAAPVQLSEISGSIEEIAWSADGSSLMVLAADVGLDTSSAQNATTIRGEDWESADPIVIRPVSAWRRLLTVDRATGATSEVRCDGLTVWEFHWDGRARFAAVVSQDSSESGWYTAHLVVCDFGRPGVHEVARYASEWQLALPRLSPEGRVVAFVEGVCSDRGILAGVPMSAEVGAGPARPIAPGADIDCTWLQWRDDRSLWCAGWRGIGSVCGVLEPGRGVTEIWSGVATLGGRLQARVSADARGRRLVAVIESANEPPEAVELDPAAGGPWRALTDLNAGLAARTLPAWSRRRWHSTDGLQIEGLLALPPDRPPRNLPLVVVIHGGPSSSWTAQWTNFGLPTLWTSAGYAVLMPNPRGSVGYGQEFARSTIHDMGGGELRDILSGIDALVEQGVVDGRRVGVLGASHGGYLAAWAITQTERFAAAVAMAAPSNRLSKHNGGNIGYLEQLFWDPDPYDPAGAVIGRSPIMYVRNIRTPTLIVHGEIDQCVPVGQAQEFYRGIAAQGRAEVELVIYPREGHSIRERAHVIDFWHRARAWFDERV
jgi:dipeptidyl aminopeptidase/acylaminoacyl peptidase